MTTYGLTPQGFVPKTLDVIQSEVDAAFLTTIRADLDLSPTNPLGQAVSILCEREAAEWESQQVLYNAINRGDAEGDALDNIGSLTGSPREEPGPSSVYVTLVFTLSGTYVAGALVAFLSTVPSVQFDNVDTIVVPSLFNGLPVSVTNPYTVDATVFESTIDGPDYGNALIAAGVGNLTGMVPVAGWASVVDIGGPTLGTSAPEDDTLYRIRQVRELAAQGSCSPDATAAQIEKALANAPFPVEDAIVIVQENTSDVVDSNGLPPHSFRAVVFDGLVPNTTQNNPIIAQVVWANKGTGIKTFGGISMSVLDSQGTPRIVFFDRSQQVPIWMSIDASVRSGIDIAQATTLILQALVAASQGQPFTLYGQTVTPSEDAASTLVPGSDVIPSAFEAIAQGQTGVVEVTAVRLGFAANPTGTTKLRITGTQIAVLPAANITLNLQLFVP